MMDSGYTNHLRSHIKREAPFGADAQVVAKRNRFRPAKPHTGSAYVAESHSGEHATETTWPVVRAGKNLFYGLHVLILPGGIGLVQMRIWRERIASRGGTIDDRFSLETTHVVSAIPRALALQQLAPENATDALKRAAEQVWMLKPCWIVDSLRANKLQPEEEYLTPGALSLFDKQALHQDLSDDVKAASVKPESQPGEEDHQQIETDSGVKQETSHYGESASGVATTMEESDLRNRQRRTATALTLLRKKRSGELPAVALAQHVDASGQVDDQGKLSYLPKVADELRQQTVRQSTAFQDTLEMFIKTKLASDDPEIQAASSALVDIAAGKRAPQAALCNHNERITVWLDKLQKFYAMDPKQEMRAYAYRKTIAFIKMYPRELRSGAEARRIPNVGPSTAEKIDEILNYGVCSRVLEMEKQPECIALMEMRRIWGVGHAKATELYQAGFRTVADVRRNPSLLSGDQLLGLKYVEDFEQKIPRDEVAVIADRVRAEVERLTSSDAIVEACGSYRRGRDTSGDIDIAITHKDNKSHADLLPRLILQLHKVGLLTDNLRKSDEGNTDLYLGVCQLRPDLPHRRIDLKVVPYAGFGCTLLYLTGSNLFNRFMRQYARYQGFTLGDKGLVMSVAQNSTVRQDYKSTVSLVYHTEEEVFDALGMPYIPPYERSW